MSIPAAITPGPPASRRELNKAATRQNITDAALGLLRTNGPGNFTAEDIAEAAGISRRTFFNYFGSTDAALAAITHSFLDNAIQQLRLRPAGEPILESAQAALMALADPAAVAPLAELFSLTSDSALMSQSELAAWDYCRGQITTVVRERTSGTAGDLYAHALAGSVIACGKAALEVWFSHWGPDLSAESLAALRGQLINAMGLLGSGFTAPQPSSSRSS